MAEAVKRTSKTVFVRWVRSGIGFPYRQKKMVRSLGLRRLNQIVELEDTPSVRGLVARIPHLVMIVPRANPQAWTFIPEVSVLPPAAAPASEPADTSAAAASDADEESESAATKNTEGEE